MKNDVSSSLEYLEMNKTEIICQLTEHLDDSEEKASRVFDFMSDMFKGLIHPRANKSQTDAYLETALRNFPFSD
jgi:hypothetical protein